MPRKKKKEKDKRPPAVSETDMAQVEKFVEGLAVIVNNSVKHYWLSSSDAVEFTTECYGILNNILKNCQTLAVRIVNGVFILNGNMLKKKNTATQAFINHLAGLEVDNFDLNLGVSEEDFTKFLEILSAQPTEIKQLGSIRDLLNQFNIKNIRTKKMIYREVMDEEMVISKKEFKQGLGGEGKGEGEVANVIAFLKGDISVRDEGVAKDVGETASNPAAMAELILRAAEIRQEEATIEGGETLVDFVVGCLRRTHEGMTQAPAFKTQRGKKKISRDLILLEEDILNRMREMSGEWDEEDLQEIAAVTEEVTDEIKMDALADEYMTKLSATQASEEKVLQFMKSEGRAGVGENKLQKKMEDRGLSIGGWRELTMKSGAAPGEGGGTGPGGGGSLSGNVLEAITHLDTLLDNMERVFSKSDEVTQDGNAQKLLDVLQEVSRDIKALTMGTDRKIQNLIEHLRADEEIVEATEEAAQAAGKELMLTRKQVLSVMSGIFQGISEPFDLIKSSLEMLDSNVFGGKANLQSTVLSIATENTQIITKLLSNLKRISTPPVESPVKTVK